MEDVDCAILSEESLGGNEVDLGGKDHSHEAADQFSLKSNEPNKDNEKIFEEPKLGMEFSSDESAYKFYVSYGGRTGFSVRKQNLKKNKRGIVTRKIFCCSKEGYRKKDKRKEDVSYEQPISRTGCEAHMICLLQKNGKYKIVSFNPSHNHALAGTPTKHMLRSNRNISRAQKAHADDAEKSGLPIKATIALMSTEVGGRENLGFLDKDYRNYIHKKRRMAMEKGDAGAVLQYFEKMHMENSSFFYSMQLDEDDMITNIFWADARSVSDYGLFGDVVCFDTTYRTNDYGRPFAPFIGVNHHKQTVIFGAALLYDETIDSFKWLFETFLGAMSRKQPKTILTDQSAAMAKAISEVFPETHHRLCVWHMYQNAAKNLSHVFHGNKKFAHAFSECVYDYEDEEEWLLSWNKMLEEYSLQENTWLKALFKLKEKWALVYGRHTFTADMKSTQRSESMNNVLKKYLKPRHDLLRFFEHFEKVLEDRRYEELIADFKMMQTTPVLSTSVEMLRHGVELYTPEVFKLFQKEYMSILDCSTHKVGKVGMTSEYKVIYAGKSQEHLVSFEASTQTVVCSCMKFSFIGILCAHALRVLDKKNVKKIPPQYILKRWTRDGKARTITNYDRVEICDNPKESVGKRYGHLCRNFREIASCAAEHEKLSSYAHERSVELLRDLEEMKKKLCLENTSVAQNSPGETLIGGTKQFESMASPSNCVTTQARGIKRKEATIGRPRGRIKDPLERKRRKSKTTTITAPTSQTPSIQEFALPSNSQVQEVVGDEIHAFDVFTQEFALPSCNSQVQEVVRDEVHAFDVLNQESLPGYSDLAKSNEEAKEFGNWASHIKDATILNLGSP